MGQKNVLVQQTCNGAAAKTPCNSAALSSPYLGEVLVKLWVQQSHLWLHILVQHEGEDWEHGVDGCIPGWKDSTGMDTWGWSEPAELSSSSPDGRGAQPCLAQPCPGTWELLEHTQMCAGSSLLQQLLQQAEGGSETCTP